MTSHAQRGGLQRLSKPMTKLMKNYYATRVCVCDAGCRRLLDGGRVDEQHRVRECMCGCTELIMLFKRYHQSLLPNSKKHILCTYNSTAQQFVPCREDLDEKRDTQARTETVQGEGG